MLAWQIWGLISFLVDFSRKLITLRTIRSANSPQKSNHLSVCFLTCLLRWPACLKSLPQWGQWYGFSPVWHLRCRSRFDALPKHSLHSVHWKGFSPVCVIWCFCRSDACPKHFPQWEHLCGRIPLCLTFTCLLRCCACLKLLSHWVHL